MKFFSEDIEFLKELYEKKKVNIYLFHEKYMLSPAQLARTINKFTDKRIIIFKDNVVTLTKKGEIWIISNRKFLFLKEKNRYWKDIPKEMKQERIGIKDLYRPNKRKIDKELFKNLEDGK